MQKLGLSLAKDGGYSKLIVVCSALLSGFTFGLPAFQGVLTAQWKVEYGFAQDTATLHQRYFQGFLYFGSMILSAFYKSFSPRQWLLGSTCLGFSGYMIIYLAYFLPIEYFPICQISMGILAGLGAGLSLGIICITPQHWLDKTRERYNPYLFIGAPIFVTITASLGYLLINIYGWSGAQLLMIGFFCQQLIVAVLFMEHPSEIQDKTEATKQSFSDQLKVYKETIQTPGLVPMIFNCAVCSGFIMSGVFTEISNVAMEEGLQTWQASTLVIYSAIPECFFRPLWGQATKLLDVATLQIIWCIIFMASQFIISVAQGYAAFIIGMITFSLGLAGYSGLKFVILIELVGIDKLPNALFFDTLFDALTTIIVPTICGKLSVKWGDTKVLFYVNCIAALLCILSSVYIRKTIMNKKEEEKSKEDEKTKEEDKMASETVNTVTKVEASSDEEEKKLMS